MTLSSSPAPTSPRRSRQVLAAAASLLLSGALAATLLLVTRSAPASASDAAVTAALQTTAASDTDRPRSTDAQRAELAADLKAARALSGDARTKALREVRAKAAQGEYGPGVQGRFERRDDRRDDRRLLWAALPADLRSDLKELRAADADDKAALRQQIQDKALAGDYGDRVKKAAERLKARSARS